MDEITNNILTGHPSHSKFKQAWDELKIRNKDITTGIKRLTTTQLDEMGLNSTQAQYQLKIDLLQQSIKRWKKIPSSPPFSFRYIEALKRVLGYLNIILGSLSSIFPPIEPFKELKELAEQMLTDILSIQKTFKQLKNLDN